MDYKGVIIEESLEDPGLLRLLKILGIKVEHVTEEHKTPWLSHWTLHTIEVPESKVEEIAEMVSHALDTKHSGSWYADFKNTVTHYIVFPGKIFRVNRAMAGEYEVAKQYGVSLGIPAYQVNFSPEVVIE